MKNYNRNISLYCPICGNDQFSCLDSDDLNLSDASDNIRFQCADCKKILTKAELIEENQDVINANIEEVQEEIIKDLEKELKKAFK